MLAEGVPGRILDHVADAIRTLLEPSSWVEKVRLSSATTLEGSYERAPISASPEVCSSDAVDRRMLPRIAELWATMLDLPVHPGPTDDFFTLGGDSLMAVRMLASVHDRLGTPSQPAWGFPPRTDTIGPGESDGSTAAPAHRGIDIRTASRNRTPHIPPPSLRR